MLFSQIKSKNSNESIMKIMKLVYWVLLMVSVDGLMLVLIPACTQRDYAKSNKNIENCIFKQIVLMNWSKVDGIFIKSAQDNYWLMPQKALKNKEAGRVFGKKIKFIKFFSTVCITILDEQRPLLHTTYIGDSSYLLLR